MALGISGKLSDAYRCYFGPKIPGLWKFSRLTAGSKFSISVYNKTAVYDFTKNTPKEVRDILRKSFRLGIRFKGDKNIISSEVDQIFAESPRKFQLSIIKTFPLSVDIDEVPFGKIAVRCAQWDCIM